MRRKAEQKSYYSFERVADAIDDNVEWYGTDVTPEISLGEYIMWINDPMWKVLIKPMGSRYVLVPCDENDMVETLTDALDSQGEGIADYISTDLEGLREDVADRDPDILVSLALTVEQYGGWFFGQEQPMTESELLEIIVDQLDLPKEDVVDFYKVIEEIEDEVFTNSRSSIPKKYLHFLEDFGLDPYDEKYVMDPDEYGQGEFDEIMWSEDVKNTLDSMASDEDPALLELVNF